LGAAESWRVYANVRFGTVADVPRDWRPGREPENGDGLRFASPDGQASITVSGSLHIWDTPEEAMDIMEGGDKDQTITYKRRGKRMLIVSGTRRDMIFYRKSILSCRDQIWNSVSIEYPVPQKAAYDSLVTRVAASLRFGGKSAQITDCK
jgi:hypothetical protein